MTPADKALRRSLITVLDTFNVAYEDIQRNGHPVLSFKVGPGTQHFGYRADQPQADGVVRKLANLLLSAGLQPKRNPYSEPPPRAKSPFKPPTQHRHDRVPRQSQPSAFPEFAEQPDMEPTALEQAILSPNMSVRTQPEIVAEPASVEPIPIEAPVEPVAPEPVASEALAPEPVAPPIERSGLVVYMPKPDFVPAEVMIIRADKDMIIMAGDSLVIPAHCPQRMFTLTEEEVQMRYAPAAFVAPSILASHTQSAPATRWHADSLHYSPPPAPIEPLAAPPPPKPSFHPGSVVEPTPEQEPVAAPDPAVAPVMPPEPVDIPVTTPMETSPEPEEAPPPRKTRAKREPRLPAQIGRILLGIQQAMTESRSHEVTATEAGQYMPDHDRKQIGARTAAAERAGWVKRRRPPGTSPAYLYSVTSTGARIAKQQAARCYLEGGLAVPPFIKNAPENREVFKPRG